MRSVIPASWALMSAIMVLWPAGVPAQEARSRTPALEIYFIDVQGGAATLVVTPERESILIDTGWPGLEDRDPKRIVHVLKDVAGCDQVDHLITTHWHRDHFGGVGGLARLVPIVRFWDRGLPEDNEPGAEFPDGPAVDDPLGIAYRAASAGKRKALRAGDTLPTRGALKSLVLAASRQVVDPRLAARFRDDAHALAANPACSHAPPDQPADASDNANSLALLFSLGRFQFLDAGDLTWNLEKRLVCPVDLIGPVDLYQVTHHGMETSNHATLVETIAPVVSIMNNGPAKGGSASVVERLRSTASIQAAYQLHRNVTAGPGGNTDPALIANHDPAGGTFIAVRVAADGAQFTVRLGESGSERTFDSR